LHPDRFAVMGSAAATYALRWTTALNRARDVLRARDSRTRYLLESHGVKLNEAPAPPRELVEQCFEMRESTEDLRAGFKDKLIAEIREVDAQWDRLAAEWPDEVSKDKLELLHELWAKKKYLSAMLRDLDGKESEP
jgi:hypothetical protein